MLGGRVYVDGFPGLEIIFNSGLGHQVLSSGQLLPFACLPSSLRAEGQRIADAHEAEARAAVAADPSLADGFRTQQGAIDYHTSWMGFTTFQSQVVAASYMRAASEGGGDLSLRVRPVPTTGGGDAARGGGQQGKE